VASLAPDPVAEPRRRPTRPARAGLAGLAVLIVLIAVAAVLVTGSGGAGSATAASAATRLIPSDALAYLNLQLGRGRPEVDQALRVAGRLPDFPLLEGQVLSRLSQVVAGGRVLDTATDISPWVGDEAAIALLDTTTSTAGSLVLLRVDDAARAERFIRGQGATPAGSYRGVPLLGYPNGSRLAFRDGWLLVGQDASVRASLDVAAGAAPALGGSAVYARAAAGESGARVLDAYASVDGVRRVLSPQAGALGALGQLLDQPALQGVALSLVPTQTGAQVHIHTALDPSLVAVGGFGGSSATGAGAPFAPSLAARLPADATLLLDVTGLNRSAPRVLNAGSAAGVAGGLGPLLSRLGSALRSEGVDTQSLVSIFSGESAVGIVPAGGAQALVVVARATDPTRVATELAELEIPLAHLFTPSSNAGTGTVPTFNERSVAGVTAHQLQLSTGFQLDYAVFRGLVVISTSLNGIAAVARPTGATLAASPAFAQVLGHRPPRVTSLVYAQLGALLGLGKSTGLTGTSSALGRLAPDLAALGATGLVSTRARDSATTDLTLQIR
jgi:hypothetical protein